MQEAARRGVDERATASSEALRGSRNLRDVSKRILAAVDELRRMEQESRTMRIGSREFHLISAEIGRSPR